MAKGIYRFYWDCGRQGELDSLFIADSEEVQKAIGKDVYFGEVLGKHSNVYGTIEEGEITLVTDDQEFITKFEQIVGTGSIVGYNPIRYLSYTDEE